MEGGRDGAGLSLQSGSGLNGQAVMVDSAMGDRGGENGMVLMMIGVFSSKLVRGPMGLFCAGLK